ncbi:MAG: site-2 protease family protein, partial [Planctomycetes bacterium]|nr:site-2 protease family protein [Planctomycetota bacterium]
MENHEGLSRPPEETSSPPPPPAEAPPPERPLTGREWLGNNSSYLIVLALLVAVLIFKPLFLVVGVGLSLLIFIHELGHFLVAKWCDVHVEAFSIGFGPALPGCSFRRGETLYKIALIPLGGYVKMVGEGPETEEEDDDPRSFKNKPVWQRMAIISAGVTMNLLLGCVCFVVAYLHGVKQQPAVIGLVDAGSPAWQDGVPSGVVIERIGGAMHPYFEDLRPEVMLSRKGEELPLWYRSPVPGRPVQEWPLKESTIEPRREANSTHPVIGVSPPPELELLPVKVKDQVQAPVILDSAAAHADPPFQWGDTIVATTDPDHPDQVAELPWDTREESTQPHSRDYFEFHRRMQLLEGKPVTIRVQRQPAKEGETPETADLQVPGAFHSVFKGLRMRMGWVSAIRQGSPAQTAGVRVGDILKKVEVTGADGKVLAFEEEKVDPLRLPYELRKWAAGKPTDMQVTLTVLRPNQPEPTQLKPVAWDPAWEFDQEVPASLTSPLAIPGLGLAYQVETTVVDADPASGLQKDDIIQEVSFRDPPKVKGKEGTWSDP